MKVVHVLKKIETIDQDVKELKKLEKSIARDKSFSTPIYMSIEKQINILLGERIKYLELRIENPPESADDYDEVEEKSTKAEKEKKVEKRPQQKSKSKVVIKDQNKPAVDIDDDDIPMLTQDDIDSRFDKMQKVAETKKTVIKKEEPKEEIPENQSDDSDDGVKLLDIALEKGSINKKNITKEKEKKVRFFRENFPSD